MNYPANMSCTLFLHERQMSVNAEDGTSGYALLRIGQGEPNADVAFSNASISLYLDWPQMQRIHSAIGEALKNRADALASDLPKLVPILNGDGTPLGDGLFEVVVSTGATLGQDVVPPFGAPRPDRLQELCEERDTWIKARWGNVTVDGGKLWAAEFPEKNAELANLLPF